LHKEETLYGNRFENILAVIYNMPSEVDESEERQGIKPEFVRMYYEHQYDRMAKLEEQGLTISNIVITINVVAFTFGFTNVKDLNIITGLGLPLMMIISNFFAIIYIWCSSIFIRFHQARSKRVIENYAPALFKIDKEYRNPWRSALGKRREIQLAIHILLILIAYIPAYVYLGYISAHWSKAGLLALMLILISLFIAGKYYLEKIRDKSRISSGIWE
jgi:hypothetical protein